MSAYVFVAVAGGSLGLLAGGALTQALNWHWIFFVNLPIGMRHDRARPASSIPPDAGVGAPGGIDWLGSVLVTASLMTAIYAIVQATAHGWGSSAGARLRRRRGRPDGRLRRRRGAASPTRSCRCASCALRGLVSSSIVRGFLVTGMYSTFFLGTLYLEHVRHFGALQTGLAFLPWTLTVGGAVARDHRPAGRALRADARAGRRGCRRRRRASACSPRPDADTSFFPTVFFAFFAIGLGIGVAFMPLLTIAMADVPAADAGLGSGIVNVSQQVSGALGLAVLGTIATNRTHALERRPPRAPRLAGRRLPPRVHDRRRVRLRRDRASRSSCCARRGVARSSRPSGPPPSPTATPPRPLSARPPEDEPEP